MTIQIVCTHCGSRINAPDSLLGQVRPCPKCKYPVKVEPAAQGQKTVAVPQKVAVPSSVPTDDAPMIGAAVRYIKKFYPLNLYLIVGHDKLMAYWKQDGWQFNVGTGFTSAKRNINEIPEHGEYVLIEGIVAQTDNGNRLRGMRFFALSGPAVLVSIGRSDTEILEKIAQKSSLSPAQKRFVLKFMREHYFPQFTEEAMDVIEFLTNDDIHSREVGDINQPDQILG